MSRKHAVPISLHKYIGADFDKLIPSDYLPDEDDEDHETLMEEKRNILLECLEMLDEVINGASIFRAIKVNNLGIAKKEILESGKLGNHWTSSINIADVTYAYCAVSGGYSVESEEPRNDWMDRAGVMIFEAYVENPKTIDFRQTIYLYMKFGQEESEIYIDDDSYLKLLRIGMGSTTGRARKDLIKQIEKGNVISL